MPYGDVLSAEVEGVATEVVDAAFKVYFQLGPGLLESVYEICLAHELRKRGLRVDRQVVDPVTYDGIIIEAGFHMDLLVEDLVVVEVKAVEKLIRLFESQALTYLKLTGKRLGILMNFDTEFFKASVKRIVH